MEMVREIEMKLNFSQGMIVEQSFQGNDYKLGLSQNFVTCILAGH